MAAKLHPPLTRNQTYISAGIEIFSKYPRIKTFKSISLPLQERYNKHAVEMVSEMRREIELKHAAVVLKTFYSSISGVIELVSSTTNLHFCWDVATQGPEHAKVLQLGKVTTVSTIQPRQDKKQTGMAYTIPS
jgi:hypothetical protein